MAPWPGRFSHFAKMPAWMIGSCISLILTITILFGWRLPMDGTILTATTGSDLRPAAIYDSGRIAKQLRSMRTCCAGWHSLDRHDGADGLQVLSAIRSSLGNIAAIIMSGSESTRIKTQLAAVVNCEYLEKPFRLSKFLSTVDRLDI